MLNAILFADDTNLFISHSDLVYLINTLYREFNKLSTWFAANRLSFNLSKTNFMVLKPWPKKQSFEFQVSINEQPILCVSETMFLDDNLTWKPHISLLASKLSKSIGIIHKSRFFFSQLNLSVPCTIQFFMFSLKNSTLSSKFNNLFLINSQIHNYNTRNAHSFRLPLCRTNTTQFSIYFQGPKFYNSLNSTLTGSSCSASFKRKLKKFLFRTY